MLNKVQKISVLVGIVMVLSGPREAAADIPAADPVERSEAVEQGEEQLGGAVLDAGENLAHGLERSLKQEAKRDVKKLEGAIVPRQSPPEIKREAKPAVAVDTFGDIKKDIQKLEDDEKELDKPS